MFDKSLITESRLAAAPKKELAPIRIDRETCEAIFVGSEGNLYETSLDGCTCPDFAIQGYLQPCKHMIRLAMETGHLPADGVQSDLNMVRARYHLGYLRTFIRNAELTDVLRFAEIFLAIINKGIPPADDAFIDSMDLQTLSDFPFLALKTVKKVKIDKPWKKDFDGILTILRNRLGDEVLMRLDNPDLLSLLSGQ